MDEFEAHRANKEEISPDIIAFYWGPGSTMFSAYDTLDSVAAIGYSDSGFCVTCQGKRRVQACSCDNDHPAHQVVRRPVKLPRPVEPAPEPVPS